jgi:ribosomal protein S18 acetylase RimI-like enzyme
MLKLGIRDCDGTLVGLIDVARRYPQPNTWYIGLLLLDPAIRNRGIGTDVVLALRRQAAFDRAARIMAAVVEENVQALRFWQARGFEVMRRFPTRRFGAKEHALLELMVELVG